VFAEENHRGDAPAGVHYRRVLRGGLDVAVDKPDLDLGTLLGDPFEDGALVDAVAAPRAGDTQHVHLAHETAQQLAMYRGEGDAIVHRLPPLLMRGRAVLGEKVAVAEPFGEDLAPLHLPPPPTASPRRGGDVGVAICLAQRAECAVDFRVRARRGI